VTQAHADRNTILNPPRRGASLLGFLLALAAAAVLLAPTLALADGSSRGTDPHQYRGPAGEVPSRVDSTLFDNPGSGERSRAPEAWARWEFWFEYEKDLLLREAMERGPDVSVSGQIRLDTAPMIATPTAEDRAARILPALREALRDSDRSVRMAAALALGNARDGDSIAALARLLRIATAPERRAAALALGYLGGDAVRAPLEEALAEDADGDVRSFAALGLGLAGDAGAVPFLQDTLLQSLRAVGREHRELQVALVTALGLLKDPASAPLLQRVILSAEVRDERLRAHAASALGRLGDVAVVPPLLASLAAAKDPAVRRAVVIALGSFPVEPVTVRLEEVLRRDSDAAVRGLAAVSLARTAGEKAVAVLAEHTAVRHPRSVRGFAALALGLTGDRRGAPEVLRNLLQLRGQDSVRSAAAVGLGILGDGRALARLKAMMTDRAEPADVRGYALLGAALTGHAGVRAAVKAALTGDMPPDIRRNAALAAGVLPFDGSAAILVRLLWQEEDPAVRGAALLGLGLSPDRGVLPILADLASEPGGAPVRNRVEAITALGQMARGGELPPVARLAAGSNWTSLTPALDAATRVF